MVFDKMRSLQSLFTIDDDERLRFQRVLSQNNLWNWQSGDQRLNEFTPSVVVPGVPTLELWIQIDILLGDLIVYGLDRPIARINNQCA
jgi:hypothetical protein